MLTLFQRRDWMVGQVKKLGWEVDRRLDDRVRSRYAAATKLLRSTAAVSRHIFRKYRE